MGGLTFAASCGYSPRLARSNVVSKRYIGIGGDRTEELVVARSVVICVLQIGLRQARASVVGHDERERVTGGLGRDRAFEETSPKREERPARRLIVNPMCSSIRLIWACGEESTNVSARSQLSRPP